MPKDSKNNPQLTRREREILELFAEGYKDKEIADELYISEMMVKVNQIRLMRKLNAEDMLSVINYALENGLITIFDMLEFKFSRTKRGSDKYIQ